MSDPWLTIIGIGEDGVAGLGQASQDTLAAAEVIMAPQRHLDLVVNDALTTSVPAGTDLIPWPVPFADGIAILASLRGQKVVVLASGDPFWFGAGSVIARSFGPSEWTALPGVSCFSLAAARLGWALEKTTCLGLHAAPMTRLRRHLAPGAQLIVTLRDGDAVSELAGYLIAQGFGDSTLHVMEHLGGPQDRLTTCRADAMAGSFEHPVCVAINLSGKGTSLTVATGQDDAIFQSDGQITKRPVRAITLSTLAPKPGEHLWDVGGGSGSIALEWLLAHPTTTATTIEPRADRASRIRKNAEQLGVENRLTIVEGAAPNVLEGLQAAHAIFVGGGLSWELLNAVLNAKVRLVVNAVTLEGEALLAAAQAEHGGELMRIALSHASPLGQKRGWTSAYPVVQWGLQR
ncbi:precorrin-6y C5,15-methyltransferase (decarboxylating) subunit CbiE [Tateyamaria omphalii]|uniref:precorrin-6y C5,15-methyltransferase (decarboxylating) subunit CbiE n=1 Tax=Tateyamaria omphalii TaxID=299262 RepID=UPI001C9936A6|nr:precorrin-6y C5,15-methyltransferase (decarboxylating) subunit CbiE [Tateyamaria omphalii]MBY5931784.1 precorrin-6y C5,15-methyltransferase (decarboxylating) subunit CbiE [Tateyamaria omphalii]